MCPLSNSPRSDFQDESAVREEIDDLIESSRELYLSAPHQARADIERAHSLSRSLKYDFGIGESLRVMGNVDWVKGDYELAVKNYTRARSVFEGLKNNGRLTLVFKGLARAYHSLGDSGNSLRFYHLALDTAESDKNDENIANCSYGLGFAYYHVLDYHRALTYFQKGLVMYEALGDKFGTAMGYNNLADVCMKISDGQRALEFALKALDLLRESNRHEEGYATEFNITIGDAYIANGDLESASSHFGKALDIAAKTNYMDGLVLSNTRIGVLKAEMHLYSDARAHLERAMHLAGECGNAAEELKCLDLLAKLPDESE